MPSMIMPPVAPSAPNQPTAPSGPRGRAADPSDGSSFGAALDRSRAGADKKPADDADTNAAVVEKLAGLKALPGEGKDGKDKKDELPSDLLNMAFLVTAQLSTDPTAAAAAVARTAADGDASVTASAAAAAAKGKTPAGLPQDTVEATLPDADDASDVAKAPLSAEEIVKAAKALASKDAAPAEDGDVQATLPEGKSRAANSAPTASLAALPATPATSANSASSASSAKPPAVPNTTTVKAAGRDTAASATADMQKALDPKTQVAAAVTPATDPKTAQAPGTPSPDTKELAPTTNPLGASALPQAAAADRAAAPADRPPVLSVAPPVGSDDWGPAIGQQMLRMSASGHHVAELNLNPAGLGPLKVTLSIGDNQAQAMFVSAHESVRKAVEAALPQLRSTLAEQGISLGQASVGSETRQPGSQGNEFAQQQNPSRQQGGSDYPGAGRIDTAAVVAPAARTAVLRHAGSGVDTFA